MIRHVAFACLAWVAGTTLSQGFEAPPTSRAQEILGSQASGPNYRIDPEVRSDGLMRLYELKTSFGVFEVTGDALIRVRIRELEALRKLDAMSQSDVFVKSFGEAAAAPLRYGADLVTDPGATLRRTASGVTNMFDRVGAGISNRRSNRDNVVTSVLGVDAARRTLAVQLGVDPYTDFPPLSSRLNDVASAAAFGGLSVKALTMAIPGGAGVAVGAASTADTVTGLLAEKTSTQIVEIVRAQLQARKIPGSVIDRLVQNRAYSPTDLLILSRSVAALNAGQLFTLPGEGRRRSHARRSLLPAPSRGIAGEERQALGHCRLRRRGGLPAQSHARWRSHCTLPARRTFMDRAKRPHLPGDIEGSTIHRARHDSHYRTFHADG